MAELRDRCDARRMPRPPRDRESGLFHVYAHSARSTNLYVDALDFIAFILELEKVVDRLGWCCISVCLLDTHYHLILDVPADSLSAGMHALNFSHASRFNARHRLRGHCFEGRYSSRRVESEGYLLALFRYVARNPLDAGLCELPADWRWSSYAALFAPSDLFAFVDASRVVGCFGDDRAKALRQLRAFVEDNLGPVGP
jgi:putative transposase